MALGVSRFAAYQNTQGAYQNTQGLFLQKKSIKKEPAYQNTQALFIPVAALFVRSLLLFLCSCRIAAAPIGNAATACS